MNTFFQHIDQIEINEWGEEQLLDIKIQGLQFVQTCFACPEQYDVFQGDERVGYIKLRWGRLRVDFPPSGDTIYEKRYDDNMQGDFDTHEQRIEQLNVIAHLILYHIEKHNRGEFDVSDCLR